MFKLIPKLEEIVKKNASVIAYQTKRERITYQELWDKARILADSLKREGILPVIVYGHKSVNMVVSILACLLANRAYIPIDTYTPKERLEEIVRFSHTSLLIRNEEIELSSVKCLTLQEINDCFCQQEKHDTSSNQIAYIIFTSGSTGKSKGVPISYDNLENFIAWILSVLPHENALNILNQASFSFDLSVADFYYSLFTGNTLVAMTKEEQKEYVTIFEMIKNQEIHGMVITPTFIKLLLLEQEFAEKNYPSLKWIYFCGELLEVSTVKKLKEKFSQIKIINAYGPTEATSAVSAVEINEEMLEGEYLPVGRVEEAAVKIEIIEDEIVLKGKSVFEGYLSGTSDHCFKENGVSCYKTGDIGKIKNGLLYCMGRKDSQIKLSGYRIELGDIESNLMKIDGITDAVVIPKYKEADKIVKSIKAFVTVSREITGEEIKAKLSQILPSYMIPKSIVILEKMPVSENRKM